MHAVNINTLKCFSFEAPKERKKKVCILTCLIALKNMTFVFLTWLKKEPNNLCSGIYIWRAWEYFMAQTCIFCFYGLVVPIGRNTKCVLFVHYKTNPLRQVMCRLDQLSFCSSHKLCLEHFVSNTSLC